MFRLCILFSFTSSVNQYVYLPGLGSKNPAAICEFILLEDQLEPEVVVIVHSEDVVDQVVNLKALASTRHADHHDDLCVPAGGRTLVTQLKAPEVRLGILVDLPEVGPVDVEAVEARLDEFPLLPIVVVYLIVSPGALLLQISFKSDNRTIHISDHFLVRTRRRVHIFTRNLPDF